MLRPQLAFAHAPQGLRDRAGPAASGLVALLVSVLMGYVVARTGSAALTFGAVGVAALFALGFMRPAFFLTAFIVIRPLLDDLSNSTIGVPSANPGGGLAVMLIVFCAIMLVTRRTYKPRVAAGYGLIVALTAASGALAMFDFGGTIGTLPISETVRITALLALYVLAANVLCSGDRVRRLFVAVGLSGVLPAVLGIKELITGVDAAQNTDLGRISGPFNGPNPLGLYCAMTALVLIRMPSKWLPNWARIAALIPILVALVPTYSRVGYIFFLVGLVLLEWRTRKRLVLAGAAIAVAIVMLVPSVHNRVLPANTPESDSPATYESYGWRVDNWGGLLGKAAKRPLIGYGTKSTIIVNPRRPVDTATKDNGGYEAHNALVRVLVEGGIVLFSAYVLFMVLLFRTVRRLARRVWPLQDAGRLLLVMWIGFTVAAVGSDDPFDLTPMIAALFAMTAALDGTLHRIQRALSDRGNRGARLINPTPEPRKALNG